MPRAKRFARKQLLRRVERPGRQQIQLTGQRRAAEIGREARRRISEPPETRRLVEHALTRDGSPRSASVIVTSFRTPRRACRIRRAIRRGCRRTCPRRRCGLFRAGVVRRRGRPRHSGRENGDDGAFAATSTRWSAIEDDARTLERTSTSRPRGVTNPSERAHEIRAGRQRAHLEPAAAIGHRRGAGRSERRHRGADNRHALVVSRRPQWCPERGAPPVRRGAQSASAQAPPSRAAPEHRPPPRLSIRLTRHWSSAFLKVFAGERPVAPRPIPLGDRPAQRFHRTRQILLLTRLRTAPHESLRAAGLDVNHTRRNHIRARRTAARRRRALSGR